MGMNNVDRKAGDVPLSLPGFVQSGSFSPPPAPGAERLGSSAIRRGYSSISSCIIHCAMEWIVSIFLHTQRFKRQQYYKLINTAL